MGFKDGEHLPVPPPRLTRGGHPWPRGRAPVPYSRPLAWPRSLASHAAKSVTTAAHTLGWPAAAWAF